MTHSTRTNRTEERLLNINLIEKIQHHTNKIVLLIDMIQFLTNKTVMLHLTNQTNTNLYPMKLSIQHIIRRRRKNMNQNLLPMNTEELMNQEDISLKQKLLMMTEW